MVPCSGVRLAGFWPPGSCGKDMTVALTSLEIAGLVRDIMLITFFAIGVAALLVGLLCSEVRVEMPWRRRFDRCSKI